MNNMSLKMYVFYCSNSVDEGQLANGLSELDEVTVKMIGLPCSGKIDVPYLVKAFETGADGVVLVTCNLNECKHLEGNMRSGKRVEAVESLLGEIGLGKGRTAVIRVKDKEDEAKQVIEEIKKFVEDVKNLPRPCAEAASSVDRRA